MTLKEMRIAANLTQTQLARKMDVQQSTVYRWETGEIKVARKHHKKLARVLKCSPRELNDSLEQRQVTE